MITVLVHGGTATRDCWRELIPLLDGTVAAVDLPGRRSRPADHATISLEGNARDVLAQMDEADIRSAHLVGHSLGGATILAIAAMAPERVRGLVFLAAPVPEDGGTIYSAVGRDAQAFLGQYHANGSASVPAPDIGQGALGDEPAVPEAIAPFFAAVATRAAQCVTSVDYIRTNTDRALAPGLQDRSIERLRAHARVNVYELQADHMVMLTQPTILAAVLRSIVEDRG